MKTNMAELNNSGAEKRALVAEAAKLSEKKVLIFDLDGTLTESKSDMDGETASLICRLLGEKIAAVMGGGDYPQFQRQFLGKLDCPEERLKNLFVLPTSGGRMYRREEGEWRLAYEESFTEEEKDMILNAFESAFKEIGCAPPEKTYGPAIEDRGSQITFSAAGQKAPLSVKEEWNRKNNAIRSRLKNYLEKRLPGFEVRMGGLTSIDVTKKGIDKAYGVERIAELTGIPVGKMVYIGDALYEGGNDSAVFKTGIETIKVSGPEETKYLLREALG